MRTIPIPVVYLVAVMLYILHGCCGQDAWAQATADMTPREEKSLVFTINGMNTPEDASATEAMLLKQPGILRARTNFNTSLSSAITQEGSGIDRDYISSLFESAGFTITDYAEQLIGRPSHRSKPAPPVRSASDKPATDPGQLKDRKGIANLSSEDQIKQYEKMRTAAIENGTPTKKYDDALEVLKRSR